MGKKNAALVAGFPVFTRHHCQWALSNGSLALVPERYMGRPRLHSGATGLAGHDHWFMPRR